MASIGPQLPPHLSKRKRTREDEDGSNTPPLKVTRRANDDEISLESDSEDEYGPSAAPARPAAPSSTARPSIGPALPPTTSDEIALDDSDEEDDGPAPAPWPAARSMGPAPAPQPPNKDEIALDSSDDDDGGGPAPAPAPRTMGPSMPPRRVQGPALPPAPLSEMPTTDADDSSDSGSDYGPALPGAGPSARRAQPAAAVADVDLAPQRDSWMLAPPSSGSRRAEDPTKLKARKFASGRAAGASGSGGGGGGGISSIWTETVEEKRRRLADAVLGRGADPPATAASSTSGAGRKDKDAEARDAQIRSYTEATRGKSLYQEHQAALKEGRRAGGRGARDGKEQQVEEEDDPSKRAFDKEKDMGLGSKINHTQRRELLKRAADFGGRFEKGRYL